MKCKSHDCRTFHRQMCFSMHECSDVPVKLHDLPYSTSRLVEGILLTAISPNPISPNPKSLVLSHFRWDRAMDMATTLCPRSSHRYWFSCFADARGYNPGVFNTSLHLQVLMEQPKSLKFPRSTSVGNPLHSWRTLSHNKLCSTFTSHCVITAGFYLIWTMGYWRELYLVRQGSL